MIIWNNKLYRLCNNLVNINFTIKISSFFLDRSILAAAVTVSQVDKKYDFIKF